MMVRATIISVFFNLNWAETPVFSQHAEPDPEHEHVLDAKPDLHSPDGQRLRAVCGTYCTSLYDGETSWSGVSN